MLMVSSRLVHGEYGVSTAAHTATLLISTPEAVPPRVLV